MKRLLDYLKGKNFVGWGLSIHSRRIRLAQTVREGERVRVLRLAEEPLISVQPLDIQKALVSLSVPRGTRIAVSVMDESLKIKKVVLPMMPDRDMPEALRWQLMEDSASLDSKIEMRYVPINSAKSESGKREFMVYGLPVENVQKTLQDYIDLGLRAIVGEPLAVSLASWQETLEPGGLKVRAILHLEGNRGDFVGIKGSHILYWKPLVSATPDLEDEMNPYDQGSDLLVQFQHCLDDFTFHHGLSQVDEAVLSGAWDASSRETLMASLGTPCTMMGEHLSDQVLLEDGIQKEQLSLYAPELGLSTYPMGEV